MLSNEIKALLLKYYPVDSELGKIYWSHARSVAEKALALASRCNSYKFDLDIIEIAAYLHDIGIIKINAPSIHCFGNGDYVQHGVLGAELLIEEGFAAFAGFCERHTGVGISIFDIEKQSLPLPKRDMIPLSMEEKLICYADKFFSKTHLEQEISFDKIERKMAKFGEEHLVRLHHYRELFDI